MVLKLFPILDRISEVQWPPPLTTKSDLCTEYSSGYADSYPMSGWRLWRRDESRGTPLAVRRWCADRVASTRRWWRCTWTWRKGQLQEALWLLRIVMLPGVLIIRMQLTAPAERRGTVRWNHFGEAPLEGLEICRGARKTNPVMVGKHSQWLARFPAVFCRRVTYLRRLTVPLQLFLKARGRLNAIKFVQFKYYCIYYYYLMRFS